MAQTVTNLSMMQETQAQIPWKGMATHASVLAWRTPWTEAGGLQLVSCSCIELENNGRTGISSLIFCNSNEFMDLDIEHQELLPSKKSKTRHHVPFDERTHHHL